MGKRVHLTAATISFVTILTFWTSTVCAHVVGGHDLISTTKDTVAWGLLLLIPALCATGATGFSLAGRTTDARVRSKKRRMPIIAATGLLVLAPSALYLSHLASRGDFGGIFYTVQAVELAAGAINLTLLGLSFRDGLRLSGRLRTSVATTGGDR